MSRRLKYVVRHEAAHAVVGVYLGLNILSAGVGNIGDMAGWCEYAAFSGRQRLPIGVMLAAGTVSDRICRAGRKCDEYDRRLTLGCGWGPHDFPMLEAAAAALLRGPLATAWDAASDELAVRDLTGREIRQIVRGIR